jgi:hypothetical protein
MKTALDPTNDPSSELSIGVDPKSAFHRRHCDLIRTTVICTPFPLHRGSVHRPFDCKTLFFEPIHGSPFAERSRADRRYAAART